MSTTSVSNETVGAMTAEHVELLLTELAFHERTCRAPQDPESPDGGAAAYLHAQQIIRRIVELAS